MTHLYNETYKENEKILVEIDSYKNYQDGIINEKDNDISNLGNEIVYLKNKESEANNILKYLEQKIVENNIDFNNYKDRMNSEIGSQLNRYSELKNRFDDTSLEVRRNEDKLKDLNIEGNDIQNRFVITSTDLNNEINELNLDNKRKLQTIGEYTNENNSLNQKIIDSTNNKNSIELE